MAIYGPGYRKSHKYPSQDWLNNDDIHTTIISGGENEEIFAHFRLNGWAAKGKKDHSKSPNMKRNTVSFLKFKCKERQNPLRSTSLTKGSLYCITEYI
jgi:hypothetical protein